MEKFEIVISGISGRFPESSTISEFENNLLQNVDMVTVNDRRFKAGLYGIPEGFGALKEIDKFDSQFFGISPVEGRKMDPQLRMALEVSYEAMVDAGVSPSKEGGNRTGVFYAVCTSEAGRMWDNQPNLVEGPTLTGTSHSMFANRISYTWDFKGPSCSYDTACSSSIVALEAAVSAMRKGECDSALVLGSTLILTPHTTLQFQKLGMLAKDGKCKAFDASGDGYVRAETVAAIYLQKVEDAKRVYTSVVAIKTNTDGYKERGVTFPSAQIQEKLLREIYTEAEVDVNKVSYVEGHGTGTPAGDPQEVLSLSRVFGGGEGGERRLLVGSVKSNMGHAEGASGLCAIAKIITMLRHGIIPANLNFKIPNQELNFIRNGAIKVVAENMKWDGGLVALNSFGFGGVNTHAIFKPLPQKNIISKGKLPEIILASGTTTEGVTNMLNAALTSPHLALLVNEAHKHPHPNHTHLGFALSHSNSLTVEQITPRNFSQLWFVFNGMGSQWLGMGKSLLKIPSVSKAIQSCHNILQQIDPKFNLLFLITNGIVNNDPTEIFVAITAIQIALVDTLECLGVKADGFIGHSAGEIGCAYADQCLTLEEAILCSYWRGMSLGLVKNNAGEELGMGVVNQSWEKLSLILPQGLHLACNNGKLSVTVSGSTKLLNPFLEKQKSLGKTATVVNSCGIAFHSPHMLHAAPYLLEKLKNVIKSPKARSDGWVTTCGGSNEADANYFVHNLTSPVSFYDALKNVPSGSTLLEIGPSGLLKGLIKKSVEESCVIPLQKRDSEDSYGDFINALGLLYVAKGAKSGVDPGKLNDKLLAFPVPISTPSLSSLVAWDHTMNWDVPKYGKNGEFLEGFFQIDMTKKEEAYLTGHQVQGRILFPATGYLVLVWKFFAQTHQIKDFQDLPVVFQNVIFDRVTVLTKQAMITFRISISDISGLFEIKEGGAVICTGNIRIHDEANFTEYQILEEELNILETSGRNLLVTTPPYQILKSKHIYRRFRLLGYEYLDEFRGIHSSDLDGCNLLINWNNNWVTFLDNLLQSGIKAKDQIHTELPIEIRKLVINSKEFLDNVEKLKRSEMAGIYVSNNWYTGFTRCKGVEAVGLRTTPVGSSWHKEPQATLSTYSFLPFFDVEESKSTLAPTLQCLSIVVDNLRSNSNIDGVMLPPRIVEVTWRDAETTEALDISRWLRVHYAITDIDYTLIAVTCSQDYNQLLQKSTINCNQLNVIEELQEQVESLGAQLDLIILDDYKILSFVNEFLLDGGFVIVRLLLKEDSEEKILMEAEANIKIVAKKVSADQIVYLLKKVPIISPENLQIVKVSGTDFSWIEKLKSLILEQEELLTNFKKAPLIYLITTPEIDAHSGLLGLILGLRKEPYCKNLRGFICEQQGINLDSVLEKLVLNDMAVNVLKSDGTWGHYVHATLPSVTNEREICLKKGTKDQAFMNIGVAGDLTTLKWHQGFDQGKLIAPGFEPVDVYFSALNFKDIMLATGSIQAEMRNTLPNILESPLGFEFSGVVGKNRRVFGYSEGQGIATQVLVDSQTVWDIPDKWSFEDAATVSVVYSTAYLALIVRGGLREGENVLIHAGAGGVGQAAIRIALSMNCNVFTTVGSKDKIEFITKEFPQIPAENISSSRDVDFELSILNLTKGKGIHVVLNSLTGEKLLASVRCIARHGRFLEIGKADLVSNKQLGLELFLKDASFQGIMLDSLWDLTEEKTMLRNLIKKGIDSGVVVPLPRRVFNLNQVEPAFRFLGQGSHIGKVLIQVKGDELCKIIAQPRIYFCPEKSYIIAGGLGGFGLELCDWMTKRYARNLIITSRSGVSDAYQEQYIRKWEGRGIVVKMLQLDASIYSNAEEVVKEALKLGPIGGFFNLTMRLDFGLMKEQTVAAFETVLSSKLNMSLNLHNLTLGHSSLNHFVLFSSVASAFGFDGQSNYGFANSAMEHLCESRRVQGLPATAIQWGGIGEVGGWHEMYNQDFQMASFRGSGVQSIRSALKILDILLTNPEPVFLSRRDIDVDMSGKMSQELSLMERIAHILGHTNVDKLSPKSKLIELGMDSVMAIEVKTVLESDYGIVLSAAEVRSCTIEQVAELSKNSDKNKLGAGQVTIKAATADLFQLNLMKNYSTAKLIHKVCVHPINDVKSEKGQGTIVFCNSIEGPDILRILGPLLTRPAYCLQFTPDMPTSNIMDLAQHYIKKIKAVVPKGPYILVGYSAGAFPAIEMALHFYSAGENEKLVLMDMTPGRFEAILSENAVGQDRENLDEFDLALVIFSQALGYDKQKLDHMMKHLKTKESKLQKFKEMASKIFDHENEEDVDTFMGMSKELMTLFNRYKPSSSYKGQATLLRTTQNLIGYDSTEFWGMDEWCENTPHVRILNTTHSYMVAEPAVRDLAAILNNQ